MLNTAITEDVLNTADPSSGELLTESMALGKTLMRCGIRVFVEAMTLVAYLLDMHVGNFME